MIPFFSEKGILQPEHLAKSKPDMPKNVIVLWDRRLYDTCARLFNLRKTASFECGPKIPVMKFDSSSFCHAVVLLPFGSPVVSSFMEQAFVWGCRNFIFIGSCGVLDDSYRGKIIVPTHALMDEGTGCHYKNVPDGIIAVEKSGFVGNVLSSIGVEYSYGCVWTTDAVFRETESAKNIAVSKGCVCVDMECSAISCVSSYLGADSYQLFYPADSLDSGKWTVGSLLDGRKQKIFGSYLDIAIKISEEIYSEDEK